MHSAPRCARSTAHVPSSATSFVSVWRASVAAAQATLSEAQADMKRWSDRAYIEAQARQRLMFVYPGDISYLVVNDVNVKPAKSDEVLSTVQTTSINWVDAFLQSYAFAADPLQVSK